MTAIFEQSSVTAAQLNREPRNESSRVAFRAHQRVIRERFLTQHGPKADLRRRRVTSKAFRKAIIAAEMARWESF